MKDIEVSPRPPPAETAGRPQFPECFGYVVIVRAARLPALGRGDDAHSVTSPEVRVAAWFERLESNVVQKSMVWRRRSLAVCAQRGAEDGTENATDQGTCLRSLPRRVRHARVIASFACSFRCQGTEPSEPPCRPTRAYELLG